MKLVYFVVISCVRAQASEENSPGFKEKIIASLGEAFLPAVQYGKSYGEKYKGEDYKKWTVQMKADGIMKSLCSQNAFAGAATAAAGQAGFIASAGIATPVIVGSQLLLSLVTSFSLQVSLVSGVATVRGFDVNDERTKNLMLATLLGDAATEPIKKAFAAMGQAGAKAAVKGSGEFVKVVNKALWPVIHRKFLTMAGSTGLINMGSWVPFIGPAISFVVDGGTCLMTAKSFDWSFYGGSYEQRQIFELILEEGGIDVITIKKIATAGWDTDNMCEMNSKNVENAGIGDGTSTKLLKVIKAACN